MIRFKLGYISSQIAILSTRFQVNLMLASTLSRSQAITFWLYTSDYYVQQIGLVLVFTTFTYTTSFQTALDA